MTDATLIARLEAATEADRELDCLAHLAKHPEIQVMVDGGGWRGERPVRYQLAAELVAGWRGDWDGFASQIEAPPYTASIDAALTLVPEGSLWGVGNEDCADRPWAWCLPPGRSWDDADNSYAATPALAICIAALRARSEGEGA